MNKYKEALMKALMRLTEHAKKDVNYQLSDLLDDTDVLIELVDKECSRNNDYLDTDLVSRLECALLHDISVCDTCQKCEGNNSIEIRMNLVRELCKMTNMELPWKEDNE